MKLAIVALHNSDGTLGGAERFYDGLHAAFRARGVNVELVTITGDESTFAAIEETYLRCYDCDVSAFDAVISTKAPTYLVRHPNHVCYLVHTMRVFYDMFESAFKGSAQARQQRALIHRLDTIALSPPRTRHVFTIGHEVAHRLREGNGIEATVLHPPLGFNRFRPGSCGDYILIPGRLHRWKRVDMAIDAMRLVESPVRLVIAGAGEEEATLRALARGDARIELVGRVSDDELVALYADALAVAFVPLREDYGYVTLEAFRSGKPVITCSDSGEPARIVDDGRTGLIANPTPQALAAAFDRLFRDRRLAAIMGEAAADAERAITWDNVVPVLARALGMRMEHTA